MGKRLYGTTPLEPADQPAQAESQNDEISVDNVEVLPGNDEVSTGTIAVVKVEEVTEETAKPKAAKVSVAKQVVGEPIQRRFLHCSLTRCNPIGQKLSRMLSIVWESFVRKMLPYEWMLSNKEHTLY